MESFATQVNGLRPLTVTKFFARILLELIYGLFRTGNFYVVQIESKTEELSICLAYRSKEIT